MSGELCLVRSSSLSGRDRYSFGQPLLDRYLEFVAGRSRPNTLRAVAFDLKTFFAVVGKGPLDVSAADVSGIGPLQAAVAPSGRPTAEAARGPVLA